MFVGSFNYFLNFGESQEKCLIDLDSSLWEDHGNQFTLGSS